jgi:hypothetical protein
MHRAATSHTVRAGSRPSGLWHQAQRNGQPARNTVDRMPGPSWIEKRWMAKTQPLGGALAAGDDITMEHRVSRRARQPCA